jgi:hypothetical protein
MPLTSPFEAFELSESERGLSCGLEIVHKCELGGKQTGRSLSFSPLENPPDINARPVKFPIAGNFPGDRCDLHCVASQRPETLVRSATADGG